MRRALMVLAVLLAAGCSSDADDAAPTTTTTAPCRSTVEPGEEEVTTDGRMYLRHVPPAHDGTRRVPLVVDLHGYSEGAVVHTKFSALGPYGDEEGFVTITPQGLGDPVRWNTQPDSDDLRFIADVLDEAERTLCIDANRIYVTGLSNGAMMTSTIGCELADRVAAIGAVAGITDPPRCTPSRRMPVVAIHGTADGFVAYEGGLGERGLDLPAADGSGRRLRDLPNIDRYRTTSVPVIVAAWAKRGGCDAMPTETKKADDVTLLAYDCPRGVDVELWRVEGGGHTWPGSALGAAVEQIVGRTTTSIDANEVLWGFFYAHPLRGSSPAAR